MSSKMTLPNDFATRLESLTASIVTEPDAFKRFALIQQRDAFLANHAPAIARLVRAADWTCTASSSGVAPISDLRQALAALNAEDKP